MRRAYATKRLAARAVEKELRNCCARTVPKGRYEGQTLPERPRPPRPVAATVRSAEEAFETRGVVERADHGEVEARQENLARDALHVLRGDGIERVEHRLWLLGP